MNPIETSTIDFEILISTVSKTSLDFLNPMFKGQDFRAYNLELRTWHLELRT